jgi:hypothetical protein
MTVWKTRRKKVRSTKTHKRRKIIWKAEKKEKLVPVNSGHKKVRRMKIMFHLSLQNVTERYGQANFGTSSTYKNKKKYP